MEDVVPSVEAATKGVRELSAATPPPQTPPLSPVDERPSTPPGQVIASLKAQPDTKVEEKEKGNDEEREESPFTPFLANMPMAKLSSLTEEESLMTIEQWIRREIDLQYQALKADGERTIAEFMEKAERTRKTLEALPVDDS